MFWSFWSHSGRAPKEGYFTDILQCVCLHLQDINKQTFFSLQTIYGK